MKKKGYYIGFFAGLVIGVLVMGLFFTLLVTPPIHEATQAQYDTMFMTPINSN